jgi:hypothetical protein
MKCLFSIGFSWWVLPTLHLYAKISETLQNNKLTGIDYTWRLRNEVSGL